MSSLRPARCTFRPIQIAIGICRKTGSVDSGNCTNTLAITQPKIASTIQRANSKRMRNSSRTRRLSSRPATSPTVMPRLRRLTTSAAMSCIAPMKIEPIKHPQHRRPPAPHDRQGRPHDRPGAGDAREVVAEDDRRRRGHIVDVVAKFDARHGGRSGESSKDLRGQPAAVGEVAAHEQRRPSRGRAGGRSWRMFRRAIEPSGCGPFRHPSPRSPVTP